MRPVRRILVAVKDPTAKQLPAVTKGAQLARAFGAHLELFHGISAPLYVDTYAEAESVPQLERKTREGFIKQLEAIAAKLRAQGLRVSVSAAWDFPVYEAIVRRATQDKADLIVAERHATRHIAPGLLQLTDWELLRNSPVPVLLVKTQESYQRPVVLAAVDPTNTLTKPASLDKEIVGLARAVATKLRGPLHAVHAYNPMPLQPPPRRLLNEQSIKKLTAQMRRSADRTFTRAVDSAGIPTARRHLVGRHPIDAIEQTARQTHSNIVVMGAVARTGLKRFFFGNTAEVLLDSLNCDMLIVKPAEFAPRVQKKVRGARFAAAPFLPGYY
jgi:universal stress protein E